jgi:hypothetical protein
VRKIRGIKPEVKAPPPTPGMNNTAWAKNTGTPSMEANHAAAERMTKATDEIKMEVTRYRLKLCLNLPSD